MNIKIFIGSSTENLATARQVKDLINEMGTVFTDINLSAIGWWDEGEFPFGKSFYESIFNILEHSEAALFVAGEDDIVVKRNKQHFGMRDNIILEFGLVEGRKGRGRAVLAVIGLPNLPSDLEGINHLMLDETENADLFKEKNKPSIRSWITQIMDDMTENPSVDDYFPKLYRALVTTMQDAKRNMATFRHNDIDTMFASLVELVTSASDDDTYITTILINSIKDELQACKSILAIDVMGPKAWITPNAYRYLATQITYYLRRNQQGDLWQPVLSEDLFDKIFQACSLLKTYPNMEQSLSGFNTVADFTFSKGQPKLEFARVLLWSKEELLSSLGDSVIAIHQAFNIPLFFKAAEPDTDLRNLDFVLFEKNDGSVSGFYSSKSTGYKPLQFNNNIIPGRGNAKQHFYSLFSNYKLMLAIDARAILRENRDADI